MRSARIDPVDDESAVLDALVGLIAFYVFTFG